MHAVSVQEPHIKVQVGSWYVRCLDGKSSPIEGRCPKSSINAIDGCADCHNRIFDLPADVDKDRTHTGENHKKSIGDNDDPGSRQF